MRVKIQPICLPEALLDEDWTPPIPNISAFSLTCLDDIEVLLDFARYYFEYPGVRSVELVPYVDEETERLLNRLEGALSDDGINDDIPGFE